MSFHRENVIWQSPDGTWNRGFPVVVEPMDQDEDFDREWGVDYDWRFFESVYSGPTLEAADAQVAADRPNPGGGMYARPSEVPQFERMKAAWLASVSNAGGGYRLATPAEITEDVEIFGPETAVVGRDLSGPHGTYFTAGAVVHVEDAEQVLRALVQAATVTAEESRRPV